MIDPFLRIGLFFDFVQSVVLRFGKENQGIFCIWMGKDLEIWENICIFVRVRYNNQLPKHKQITTLYDR